MKNKNFIFGGMLIILITTINSYAIAQKKSDIVSEINDFYKTKVQNVTYDKSEKELFDAMYIVVLEKYPNIVKESESKLYIEAKTEYETYKSTVFAEIRGEKQPYRVVFSLKSYSKLVTSYSPLTYSDWTIDTKYDANAILKLQKHLYEIFFGEIELPSELKSKIDEYNNSQKKDKNKVVKGKDY